jgi:4-hydroxy-3-methylbut-2-enyl diphosphate reductase
LDPTWFDQVEKVGISAGASTPDYLIDQVHERIKQFSLEEEEVY